MLDALNTAVLNIGFCLRGGFNPEPQDVIPPLLNGREARTVVLIGSAGPEMWRHFQAERPDVSDPLDTWTRLKLDNVAERFGARAVFPFERPFLPFQRWLRRAEACRVSPLRILIHPELGLWHAIRGALLFADPVDLPTKRKTSPPCKGCTDHPCMTACPVGAFSARGLDTVRCAGHLSSDAGRDCMERGCLARRACPIGRSHQHGPDQAAFHMAALREHHKRSAMAIAQAESSP